MSYHGDISLGSTIDIKFTTVNSSGAPTTLAGSPAVAAYPGNSTTEITAGITLSVDFDSRTGLHNVRIVATSGNGYAAGDYTLVITAGTVGGASVVGYVVGSFSIDNRSALRPATAGRTLDVDANGKTQARLAAADVSGNVAANVTQFGGTNGTFASGRPEVNMTHIAGTEYASADFSPFMVSTIQDEVGDALTPVETHLTDIKGATFDGATDSLEAIRNRGDAAWITATGFLDAAGVRGAVGLASANLDTQLSGILSKGNDIEADTQDIQSRLPAALVGGRIDSSVGALAANVITDTAINAGAITAAKIAAAAITATQAPNLDAAVSTRLATAGYTAPDNTTITEIRADMIRKDTPYQHRNTGTAAAETVVVEDPP